VTPLVKDISCVLRADRDWAGSDAGAIQTTATLRGDHYVLDGTKIFITNGAEADIAVVFATVNKSMRTQGIIALIVQKGTPGFSVGKKERKLGVRVPPQQSYSSRAVRFPWETDSARKAVASRWPWVPSMPADQRSGPGCWHRPRRAGGLFGLCHDRQQFGRPISDFQAVQWMLADMATQVDAARLLAYRAALLKNQGLPYLKEAAMAKLFAAETAMSVTTKAVQIHGGYGYIKTIPSSDISETPR